MSDQPERIDFSRMAAECQKADERMERLGLLDLAIDEAMKLGVGWIPEKGGPLSGKIVVYLRRDE